MESKIKAYVDSVFRDVPATERANNIKSEILQNLTDKYHDLISEGKNEEEAYAIAISSGGDLSGIVTDLKGENVKYSYTYEKQFERMYEKQYKREKKKVGRFNSLLWPIVACAYLLFSFLVPGAWAYSWILFIISAAVSSLARFMIIKSNPKARKSALGSFIWTAAVVLYFILSFTTGRWDVTWILFVLTVAVSQIVHIAVFREDDKDDDDDDDDKNGKKKENRENAPEQLGNASATKNGEGE